MKPILILIRGNSGSGKTVLATQLQQYFGTQNCLLLHQDVIRRELLHANDRPGTPAISLIETLVTYGYANYHVTILEGILRRDVYGDMLAKLMTLFGANAFCYYIDLPFAVTVKHNQTKSSPFSTAQLKSWWRDQDELSHQDHQLFQENMACWVKSIIASVETTHF